MIDTNLFFRGNRENRKKSIDRHMKREKRKKVKQEEARRKKLEEEMIDRQEIMNEIVEEKFLDIIEDEVDRMGGINGLDGKAVSDILSYYIANDPRLELKLQRELKRKGRL